MASVPHPHPSQGISASSSVVSLPDNSPNKMTPNAMCKHGQELVQEITQKMFDILSILKNISLPPERNQGPEKKARVEELIHRTETTFQKLRLIYDNTCNLTKNLEHDFLESILIPEELDMDDAQSLDQMRTEEEKKLIEQIRFKNQVIKETIDIMRKTIWKTDTMLLYRKMP